MIHGKGSGAADAQPAGWRRLILYREVRTRTTWAFRLALVAVAGLIVWLTAGLWTTAVGRSLVCASDVQRSDAILVDNFDPDYLLFERARNLRNAGMAPRVLVPVTIDQSTGIPRPVAMGMAEVLARLSRIGSIETVPIREVEPITLNAARDIGAFLSRERITSVIVVTPLFRSRRSALIYAATLGKSGVRLHCEPGPASAVEKWTDTWHGIQNVVEQWIKLQYYRLYVLPRYT